MTNSQRRHLLNTAIIDVTDTPAARREHDMRDAAAIGREILRLQAQWNAADYHKWAVRLGVESYLVTAAEEITAAHGPMSEGRAELILARAEATLAGHHGAADALARELAGVA